MDQIGKVLKDERGYAWYIRDSSEVDNCVQDLIGADLIHEVKFLDNLIELSSPRDLFIDIGAHVGYYSIRLAEKFLQVHAFEPSTYNISGLVVNTALNNIKNISIFRYALGIENGTDTFLERGAVSCMDKMTKEYIINKNTIMSKIPITLRTLDSLYPDPKEGAIPLLPEIVLKMDTEGMELDILEGGKNFFKKNKIKLLIEHHESKVKGSEKKIIDFLENNYYKIFLSEDDKILASNNMK
jgi:FkbM family methyltransferase